MADIAPTVPSEWKQLPLNELSGPVLVLGAPDTGKSTLTLWLNDRLKERKREVAVLDGDPGQSTLGVPGTMSSLDLNGRRKSWFVGSTSPRGNMLAVLCGAHRLTRAVSNHETLLYDTSGLIDPASGGLYLKRSLVDLLQPEVVISLQQADELEPLPEPLRRRRDLDLFELPVADESTRKDRKKRIAYRRQKYRAYFQEASDVTIDWTDRAVWPKPEFERGQLVGLCVQNGFLKELGIVTDPEPTKGRVTLRTSLESPGTIAEIRTGSLRIDVDTYRDELIR